MNIEIESDSGDPRERREEVVSLIAAREHAAIIADGVRQKLERYITLEIFSTEKDDHTKSLSERVTILEAALGELRREREHETRSRLWELEHRRRRWWHFGRRS